MFGSVRGVHKAGSAVTIRVLLQLLVKHDNNYLNQRADSQKLLHAMPQRKYPAGVDRIRSGLKKIGTISLAQIDMQHCIDNPLRARCVLPATHVDGPKPINQ